MLVPAKALGEPTDIEGFAWSPDGKTIRLIKNNKLWEMSSDGSGIHPLLSNWHAPSDVCCGHWSPDGRFFVFQVSDHIPGTTFNFVSRRANYGSWMSVAGCFARRQRSRPN